MNGIKDEIIESWQATFATQAALLEDSRHRDQHDSLLWAFMHTMGSSKELCGLLYDIGHPEDPILGPPEPDWAKLEAIEILTSILEETS